MTTPLSQSAINFGVVYHPHPAQPGQTYYRALSVDGPLDRGGNANIYVDVLDEHGQRLSGIPVRFFWNNGQFISNTEPKPDEPDQGTNMNMSAAGPSYGVHVEGLPSDVVWGMGMVAFEKHKSWRVVFQRATADSVPQPPTQPPLDARAKAQAAYDLLGEALASWPLALALTIVLALAACHPARANNPLPVPPLPDNACICPKVLP